MKKTRKNLKGTVLFTTVSVMALLILFLMGTLMLATASNGRAHKTYSSSQASYTARAAIDGFITAMERQPEVAVAVQQLGEGGDPIYPTVKIGEEGSLGRIVRIDEHGVEHFDEIVVENTGEKTYTFFDAKTNGVSKEAWHESDLVKITASARVGGEIETVSAYINKAPANYSASTPAGTQVKGLQVVGGSSTRNGGDIFGGYGANLSDDPSPEVAPTDARALKKYVYDNDAHIESALTFINANFVNATSTFEIIVKKPADGGIPYSKTVITGNMFLNNNKFITLDYQPESSWDNSQIPYCYVNGAVYMDSKPDVVKDLHAGTADAGAFNFICGTFQTNPNNSCNFDSTNVYMMDEYTSVEQYEVDTKGEPKTVVKGDNRWGGQVQGTLSSWSASLFEKTDMFTQMTNAGSIFCNGRLTTGGLTVAGDLRVKGDLILDVNSHDTIVYGNLFVGGHIILNGTNHKLDVKGNIYVSDELATATASSDLVDYVTMDNVETLTTVNDVTKYDTPNEVIKMDAPKFRVYFMNWDTDLHTVDGVKVNPLGEEYTEDITGTVYYKLKDDVTYTDEMEALIGDMNFALSGEGSPDELALNPDSAFAQIRGSFDYSNYYTTETAELDENIQFGEDTIYFVGKPRNIGTAESPVFVPSVSEIAVAAEYWYFAEADEARKIMTPEEAEIAKEESREEPAFTGKYTVKHIETGEVMTTECESPVSYWFKVNDEYQWTDDEAKIPRKITKVDGYLPLSSVGFTVDDIYPPTMTREVIYGVQKDGFTEDGEPGTVQESTDPEHQFITNILDAREELGLDRSSGLPDLSSYPDSAKLDKMIDEAKSKVTGDYKYHAGQKITKAYCEITTVGQNSKIVIETPADVGDVTILLDGTTLDNSSITFKPANPDQKLNIILKGTVKLNNSFITPVNLKEPVEYTDDYGMNYFGYVGSTLQFDNRNYVVGSFRTPYTTLKATQTGSKNMQYISETGTVKNLAPNIIGNAIFADIDTGDNFCLYYTKAGMSGSSGGVGSATVHTDCGDFIVGYYGAS